MAWSFGDGFDLYAATADAINGYWDSGATTLFTLVAGRFASSQAVQSVSVGAWLTKSSAVNDAAHHIVCAFRQTATLTGSTLGLYLELFDGATAQCSIVFRSDGAILLTSGGPAGTALATYTGAVAAANTWYAFEFEVVINNTTGSFAARKNGNTVNDFSATALNTRPTSTNNYANKLTFGQNAFLGAQQLDDFFWQSGAATGAWLGDIRCYTRMPSTTASAQFSVSPNPSTLVSPIVSTISDLTGTSRYTPFTPTAGGTVGSIAVNVNTGFTGNMKCSIFADSTGAPGVVLGSATNIVNPIAGNNTFTFGTPVAVIKGVQYWWGVSHDVTAVLSVPSISTGKSSATVTYASFPTASPTVSTSNAVSGTVNVTPTNNVDYVNEAQEDGATSYVYDSNPGDADFYSIGSIASTPASVVAVTTRGYMEKSDAGARTAAVQMKSGSATVATPTLNLSTTFLWAWRTDTVDPNTGAAWTPTAVNNVQIGPTVIA